MNVVERNTKTLKRSRSQKPKGSQSPKKSVGSLSASGNGNDNLSKAVAGFIESDKFTVCGGLIAACGLLRGGDHCVFRTPSSKHVIVIVNSEHCKMCKCASVQESDFDNIRTRAYLRGMFQLKLSDTVKLSELISELTRTQRSDDVVDNADDCRTVPFTGTPPYCTIENVKHISSVALEKLIEFDKEFVWGDNLIFNTTVVEHSEVR